MPSLKTFTYEDVDYTLDPKGHAAADTEYGAATEDVYGHVKLTSKYAEEPVEEEGVAASARCVYEAYVSLSDMIQQGQIPAIVDTTPGTLSIAATKGTLIASFGEDMSNIFLIGDSGVHTIVKNDTQNLEVTLGDGVINITNNYTVADYMFIKGV